MNKNRAKACLIWSALGENSIDNIENRLLEEVDRGFITKEEYKYLQENWNDILEGQGILTYERRKL